MGFPRSCLNLIARIALLCPGIAAIMIAADFPEARRVLGQEFDRLNPFGALPEIQMRHHQPHRAAMFGRQWLTGPAMGEQCILGCKVVQREVGGVAVMGMQHDEARILARLAGREQLARSEPLPLIVVARPGRDAVDVGGEPRLLLGGELGKGPEHGGLDCAVDVEPPALARNWRHDAEIEHRPVFCQMLAGRQALIFRARDLAGQKAAFARPFFLRARQLAVGWRLVGHELLVPVHRGGMLGAAHGGIDDQRQADDTSEIVVEPLLMPDALEIERDCRRRTSEHRDGDRIGQAYAEVADRADEGRVDPRWALAISKCSEAGLAGCSVTSRLSASLFGEVYIAFPSKNGNWRGPLTVPCDQVTVPAGSRAKSGIRFSHSSNATCISMRARFEPTQRWIPRPKAAWRFSRRSITTLSASGNIFGSRLAAGKDSSTMLPALTGQPEIVVSLTTWRAIVTGE